VILLRQRASLTWLESSLKSTGFAFLSSSHRPGRTICKCEVNNWLNDTEQERKSGFGCKYYISEVNKPNPKTVCLPSPCTRTKFFCTRVDDRLKFIQMRIYTSVNIPKTIVEFMRVWPQRDLIKNDAVDLRYAPRTGRRRIGRSCDNQMTTDFHPW